MSKLKYFLVFAVIAMVGCTERVPGGADSGPPHEQGTADQGPGSETAPPWKDMYVPPVPDQAQPPWLDQFVPPVPDQWVPPVPDTSIPPWKDQFVPPVPDQFVPPVPDKSVPPVPDKSVPPVPDQFVPTGNGTCANAKQINFNGSKVSFSDTTSGKSNEYGTAVNCNNYSTIMAGNQAYYKINLVGGQTYLFTVASQYYYAYFYIFTGCGSSKINSDCGSKGKSGDVSASIYKGQSGSVIFKAPYTGTFYVAVDSRYSSSSYVGPFTLTVQKYTASSNGTCAKAQQLKLTNGKVSVSGTTATSANEFGTAINCKSTYYTYPGKQVYYRLNMTAGHTYRVKLNPSFYYAVMYIFRSQCYASAINNDCGSGGKTGAVDYSISTTLGDTIEFKPTVTGAYTIAVDSRSASYSGAFTLEIEDYKVAANSKCTSAKYLPMVGGKASVSGNTNAVSNEYGTQIRCGMSSYYAQDGRQLYYRVILTKGKQYKITLNSKYYYAYFYTFRACGASTINGDCGSGGKTGLVSGAISNGSGSMILTSPVSGSYYIAVDSISTAASYSGAFTLNIEEHKTPTNGKCASPQAIKLVGGKATVKGSTTGLVNEFGTAINCKQNTYYVQDGPQAYYWLSLTAGQTYKVSLSPTFYAGLYIFGNTCSASVINNDCGSNGKTGAADLLVNPNQTDTIMFTPSKSGLHRIAVDSRANNYHGDFTLAVEQWKKPTNSSCAKAQAVKVPTTITNDTTGATNEFGTAINCGDLMTIMRSTQLYYKVSLSAGKTYTFKMSSKYHMARFYIFAGICTYSAINGDCGSGGKTGAMSGNIYNGQTGTVTFKPSKSGTYIVAVDGTYPQYFGGFTLTIN